MGKMLYCAAVGLFPVFCAISSAVERYLHTVDVIGSIPISHITHKRYLYSIGKYSIRILVF